jgi:hypothetical protein
MVRHHALSVARAVLALTVSFLVAGSVSAQVVGENVNMVSGTEWPGGDPFLQRQNEPTIAVSSVNPQHLMAGANDYRSVDVPDPAYGKIMGGDAWLGVFKSFDGGQTWKSYLLEGYPQDPHCQPKPANPLATDPTRHRHHRHCSHASDNSDPTPALCGLPAAADPVMRAGTDGLFYFLGLNFARDKSVSRIFVGRFIDLNNKENGDATRGTDTIRFMDTRIVASSTDQALSGGKPIFMDKPWMAVDVPRAGAKLCTVPDPAGGTRNILGGTVYVAWAQFNDTESASDVMLTWSSDCGATWVPPRKLNTVNSILNQGVSIAIEPITGRVYVTWRRAVPPNKPAQVDAIMATRSEGRNRMFAAPRVIAKLIPFDLGSGDGQARTQTMPSMAISSDGASSWAHVVWAARDGLNGMSKIWMSNAKIFPPPSGDQDADDPDDYEDETRVAWSKPAQASVGDAKDDLDHRFTRGHQYMPSITAGQGKLVLFYYDTRFDHTRRYYRPYPLDPVTKLWSPDSKGKFYQEELAPIGDRDYDKNPSYPLIYGNVGLNPAADIFDGAMQYTRHTVDVRVGMASPGLNPSFSSVLVSKFPFGLTGAESKWLYDPVTKISTARTVDLKVPSFGAGNTIDPVPTAAGLTVMTKEGEVQVLQQLQLNPPGFPMFKGHSTGFMGDYIDIQGQTFVPIKGGWAYNLAPTRAPVFHAVWTSNQDVKVPFDANGVAQWGNYTPVTLMLPANRSPVPGTAAGNILFDGGRVDPNITAPNITATPIAVCDPATTGSRDQNIYTARITDGLQVSTPQNYKVLDGQTPVGFVIAAANTTPFTMTVTFGTPVTDPPTVDGARFSYTTSFTSPVATVTADIAPFSSVSRTLFVVQGNSLNSAPTIMVKVTESSGCGGANQPTCREGALTFNPPLAIASLVAPDGAASTALAGEVYTATIGAPNITAPNPGNPNITAWNLTNPNITAPNITAPNITAPNITAPNITAPNITAPNITAPNITAPNITAPNITAPNITATPVSDANYTIKNEGNTNASYFVKVVGDGSALPSPTQLIVSKTYMTQTAVGCDLKLVPHDQVVVSVPDISSSVLATNTIVQTGVSASSITNATLALAPGESATVTLRSFVPVDEMAKVASAVTPAPVPAAVPPSNTTTYKDWGSLPGQKPFIKQPSTTTLTSTAVGAGTGRSWTATVTPSLATGTVTFVYGGVVVGAVPLAAGSATLTFDPGLTNPNLSNANLCNPSLSNPNLGTPGVGGICPLWNRVTNPTMVAFYSGDDTYAASSSNAVQTMTAFRLLGYALYPTRINVGLQTEAGTVISSGAVVVVMASHPSGSANGPYYATYSNGSWQASFATPIQAGSTVSVTVEVTTPGGGSLIANASAIMPETPSITAPTIGQFQDMTLPNQVSWTYPAGSAPATPSSYNVWTTAPGGAGASPILTAAGSLTDKVIPANTVLAGDRDVRIEAVNSGSLAGPLAAGSYFSAKSTVAFVTAHFGPTRPASTLTLVTWPNPGAWFDPITVSGFVTAPASGPAPSGNIALHLQGGASLGALTINCAGSGPAWNVDWSCGVQFQLPATWTVSGTHTYVADYTGDNNYAPGSAVRDQWVGLPFPQLEVTGKAILSAGTEYTFRIANWAQFSDEVFVSTGAASCPSRTWVDVYDADARALNPTSGYIYGFCALGRASDMTSLWFYLPGGSTVRNVMVSVTDRGYGLPVWSNQVALP